MKMSTVLRIAAHLNTFFVGLGLSVCLDALDAGRFLPASLFAAQVLASVCTAIVLDRMAYAERCSSCLTELTAKKRRNCFESGQADQAPAEVP